MERTALMYIQNNLVRQWGELNKFKGDIKQLEPPLKDLLSKDVRLCEDKIYDLRDFLSMEPKDVDNKTANKKWQRMKKNLNRISRQMAML